MKKLLQIPLLLVALFLSSIPISAHDFSVDGEWNAIDLNCSAGMYLLTINDGTQVKTLRLIVK